MTEYWKDKQVLVTGAGGFIGSHLVERLAGEGARVRAFVRYNSRGDPGLLTQIPSHMLAQLDIIAGDLRDLPAVAMATQGVEIIFHLGALIAIPYSYLHPVEVVESNILGTLNVMLASKDNRVARIVHTSTSEVYGTAQRVLIDETHPLKGQSPYSASKIGADKLAESFYCSFDTPVVTLRPFNTYGPRQSARAVIPTIIAQALCGEMVYLGNVDALRDLTYVSDTVEGFIRAAQAPGVEGQTINLGVGYAIRIGDLAKEIISIIGRPVEIQTDPARLRPEKSEVQRLTSDNTLARERLGWAPSVGLHEGLLRTIEWIAGNLALYHPDRYQI